MNRIVALSTHCAVGASTAARGFAFALILYDLADNQADNSKEKDADDDRAAILL